MKHFPMERRKSLRVPVRYPVIYPYLPSNSRQTATIDLSAEGAALEALDAPPTGAAIAFLIVTDESEVVEAAATVVRASSSVGAPYCIGVRFVKTTPPVSSILDQLTLQR